MVKLTTVLNSSYKYDPHVQDGRAEHETMRCLLCRQNKNIPCGSFRDENIISEMKSA